MSNEELSHILWLGGSPCAGKSTIADRLAQWADLPVYHVDAAYEAHKTRADPVQYPTFHRLSHLECDDLWMRPVATQFATEIDFCAEEFSLIVEDLLALPTHQPILVEGTSLLPSQVSAQLTSPRQAIWLVPSESFQRTHYARRPWIRASLKDCRQPAQAFENWMARDARFARWVAAHEAESGLRQPHRLHQENLA